MNDFTFPEDNGQAVAQALRTRDFNPNEHMVQLKNGSTSQDYLPVKWRLVWFRAVYPQGTIDTEEMAFDLDREFEVEAYRWNPDKRRSEKYIKQGKGYARFRAVVTTGLGGRATGTKAENGANFNDFGEKAETGAIGRALAALGFGTQFSDQEFAEGENKVVDSPVERPRQDQAGDPPPPPPAPQDGQRSGQRRPASPQEGRGGSLPATKQQITTINKLLKDLDRPQLPAADMPDTFDAAAKMIAGLSSDWKLAQQRDKKTA